MSTIEAPTDFYKLLGVPYNASNRDIMRAYRTAMKDTHPDKVAPAFRVEAEERCKLLNQALRTLTKPGERLLYDQTIRKEIVQEQIMSQYFGGMGIPGSPSDRFGDALRREQTVQEQQEKLATDRSAVISVLTIFGGATALVVCLIVVWSVVSALVHALL